MISINLLEGNLFDCAYDRSNLPTHDQDRSIYECGSNTFNVLYYIWLSMIVLSCLVILILWCWLNNIYEIIKMFQQWLNPISHLTADDNIIIEKSLKQQLQSMMFVQRYITTSEIIRELSLQLITFIVFILMPIYIVLSIYYHTHTYEYAWTVALMYLSGIVSVRVAIGGLTFFSVFLILAMINLFVRKSCDRFFNDNTIDINKSKRKNNEGKVWSTFTIYTLINMIIVGGVNIAYVLAELYQTRSILVLCQILFSIFKLVWNNIISPVMVREIVRYLSINEINMQSTLFFLQFVISIFNNIIIPGVTVVIISPNCFYHVFQQESDVTSTYSFKSCSYYYHNGSCQVYSTFNSTTTYSPPFTYSYQCSSDLITYYAPVFVFVCILSTFIFPIIQILWIRWKLPNILRFSRVFYPNDDSEVIVLMYIDQVYKVLVFELTLLGLLITFGVIFPPLGVAFFLTITVSSYYHQAVIGRFIISMIKNKRYSHLDILEDNLKVQPLLSTMRKCGWFLLYVSCSFYTLFLFDILGDDVGFYQAYWVLIVIPCIPVLIHISFLLIEWIVIYRRGNTLRRSAIDDADIQMNPLAQLDAVELCRDSSMIDLPIEDRFSEPLKE